MDGERPLLIWVMSVRKRYPGKAAESSATLGWTKPSNLEAGNAYRDLRIWLISVLDPAECGSPEGATLVGEKTGRSQGNAKKRIAGIDDSPLGDNGPFPYVQAELQTGLFLMHYVQVDMVPTIRIVTFISANTKSDLTENGTDQVSPVVCWARRENWVAQHPGIGKLIRGESIRKNRPSFFGVEE